MVRGVLISSQHTWRALRDACSILGHTADAKVKQVLEQLGWDGAEFIVGRRVDLELGVEVFELLCARIRELTRTVTHSSNACTPLHSRRPYPIIPARTRAQRLCSAYMIRDSVSLSLHIY